MRNRGFTLLEVLLALAVVGMLLVAMNTFIFSMGELWGRNTAARLFDQHVNAVTRHLQEQFRSATFPPAARVSAAPVAATSITPANSVATNLVTFDLPQGSRLLDWAGGPPLPEVTCSLQAREHDGLYLLWHSRLETRYSEDPPRETQLTPLVTAMEYDYYDDSFKRWTTETALRIDSSGNPITPQRLRLRFEYGKRVRETLIVIPTLYQGVPNP